MSNRYKLPNASIVSPNLTGLALLFSVFTPVTKSIPVGFDSSLIVWALIQKLVIVALWFLLIFGGVYLFKKFRTDK